jgi:hypothetical protein
MSEQEIIEWLNANAPGLTFKQGHSLTIATPMVIWVERPADGARLRTTLGWMGAVTPQVCAAYLKSVQKELAAV